MSAPARSIIFTPPPEMRRREEEKADAEKKLQLFVEPHEEIVLLGLMMSDVKILHDVLQTLPFGSVDNYRGNLRVVAGAAERLRKRAAKLLREDA